MGSGDVVVGLYLRHELLLLLKLANSRRGSHSRVSRSKHQKYRKQRTWLKQKVLFTVAC